jgi:hypothetical protein
MKGDRPRFHRPAFLVPLFSAALSALVVVGVYEVRARVGRPGATDKSDPGADTPADGSARTVPAAAMVGCADLRRRYRLQCSTDLPAEASPAPRPSTPPTPPTLDPRTEAELSAWLHPSAGELGEMARHCEVRFDMPAITDNEPPTITDEQAAALSLSEQERDVLQRTLRELHADLRGLAKRALTEGGGPAANVATATMEEMLTELQTRPGGGFEEAREKLARERATAAAPVGPNAQQPPGERLLRMWATLGDQFERQLAADLGGDRARHLRASPLAGWMNRFSQAGCRSDSPPPPR